MTAAGALLGRRVMSADLADRMMAEAEAVGGVVVGVAFFQGGEYAPDGERSPLPGFWLLVVLDGGELVELEAMRCRLADVRRWFPLVGDPA